MLKHNVITPLDAHKEMFDGYYPQSPFLGIMIIVHLNAVAIASKQHIDNT